MIDLAMLQWASLGVIAGAFAVAIWALRDPEAHPSAQTGSATKHDVLRFRIRSKNRQSRIVEMSDGACFGRGSDCEIVVDEPSVSRHHARVRLDDGAWLDDLGSTNGTFVNGRQVTGTTALRGGDRIALGTAKIDFLGLVPRGHVRPKG